MSWMQSKTGGPCAFCNAGRGEFKTIPIHDG